MKNNKLLKLRWFLTYLGKDDYGYANWETNQRIYWIYRLYLKIGLFFNKKVSMQ